MFTALEQSDATLIAAVVAAAAALLSLVVNVFAARGAEERTAHRAALAPLMADIGSLLNEVLACSSKFLQQARAHKSLTGWHDRVTSAAAALTSLRPKLRYPLYGIDGPLMTVARVARWVQHYQGHLDDGDVLLEEATRLRVRLDRVIMRSYRKGRPPQWWERWWVKRKSDRLWGLWDARMRLPRPEAPELEPLA